MKAFIQEHRDKTRVVQLTLETKLCTEVDKSCND